ncbi:MAG: S1 RNA-binding domain-containing protein, partial [Bacilli bacterium]|nr:S1 RNA-binding domain-containing protein [Bacilli bacterium]
ASNVMAVTDMNAVKVDLEDDGKVVIYHSDQEVINRTRDMILDVVREVEAGEIYPAKVVKVEDFGCFVQVWPGCEGLVHVSELAYERVKEVKDVVSLGDEIIVKCLGVDKKGRLNFSRKQAMPAPKKKEQESKTTTKEEK